MVSLFMDRFPVSSSGKEKKFVKRLLFPLRVWGFCCDCIRGCTIKEIRSYLTVLRRNPYTILPNQAKHEAVSLMHCQNSAKVTDVVSKFRPALTCCLYETISSFGVPRHLNVIARAIYLISSSSTSSWRCTMFYCCHSVTPLQQTRDLRRIFFGHR